MSSLEMYPSKTPLPPSLCSFLHCLLIANGVSQIVNQIVSSPSSPELLVTVLTPEPLNSPAKSYPPAAA